MKKVTPTVAVLVIAIVALIAYILITDETTVMEPNANFQTMNTQMMDQELTAEEAEIEGEVEISEENNEMISAEMEAEIESETAPSL